MKSISKSALLLSCAVVVTYATPAMAIQAAPASPVAPTGATASAAQDAPAAPSGTTSPDAQETAAPATTTRQYEQPQNGDIVVTARRREEALSKVPIAITAFTQDTLLKQSISSIDQLTQVTPGLNFGRSGGSSNPQIVIRGQSRSNIGDAAQPVLTYFADVPLPYVSSILPTYDLASVQVLKGPQGTLFGRNSTSGAVLAYPVAPGYTFGGYASLEYGNYNRMQVEGAVNIPVVEDHVALRFAGQYVVRDGYTTSIITKQRLDDQDDASFRASLLLEFGDFKNTTVYDFVNWDRAGDGSIFNAVLPGAIVPRRPGFNGFFDCGTSAVCDVDLALALQQQIGVRRNQSEIRNFLKTRVTGLSNTSTLDVGKLTIKNIFGYRTAYSNNVIDTDGTTMGLTIAENLQNFRQISDELQLQGSLLDDRLDFILGGFYLKSEPNALNGLIVAPFLPLVPPTVVLSYRTQESKALFGQVTYDFGGGFKADLGARHTWDDTSACALGYPANRPYTPGSQIASFDQCRNGGTITINGVQTAIKGTSPRTSSAAWTYNVGLNYQATDRIFLYATARRGYRSGGINTPILGGTLTPFQSYAPETVFDTEVGVKTRWSVGTFRGTFNVDVFRGIYSGSQRGVNGTNNNFDGDGNANNDPSAGTIIINAGKARVQGVDVDLSVTLARGFTLSAFGTYNDEKYLNTGIPVSLSATSAFPANPADTAFPYAPALTLGSSVDYETSLGHAGTLVFNANVYRASRTFFSPFKALLSLSQPTYAVANARVDWRDIGGSPISVAVYARNLFDKQYTVGGANTATASGYTSVFYAEPRMYGVQARVKF